MTIPAVITAAVTLALTGLAAGMFFAYSVSVMLGLDDIRPDAAMAAMRSINRRIQNPVFFLAFLGAPLFALVTGVLLLAAGPGRAAVLFLAAAGVYLVGAFGVTVVVNVPMNDALDAAETPADPAEAARRWSAYSRRWTRWNTVRAVFSLVSLVLVGVAGADWAWAEASSS